MILTLHLQINAVSNFNDTELILSQNQEVSKIVVRTYKPILTL